IALNVLHSFCNLQASLCYTRWQHFSAAPKNQTESSSGKASLTERCRLRLLNKKEVDWNFRVPGPFAYFSVMKSI
ncbi:MAG: hypothetical protein IJB01_03230, partial [Bacteroidaceae bacterium]|nr:hypothetical protein [Bacteroidaceae bacterium]